MSATRNRSLAVTFFMTFSFILFTTFSAYSGGGAPDPDPPGPANNGSAPFWCQAGKAGIGTSYEQYDGMKYSDSGPTGVVSKVWFTIAGGIITETSHGLIHEAQIGDLQFMITGNGFVDEEKVDTNSEVGYLHTDSAGRPLSLAYRIVNTDKDGKYRIEKHILTDPDRQSLFMRVIFTANEDDITPFILINPYIENTGDRDVAYVGANYLNARNVEDSKYLSLKSSAAFLKTSAGFVGQSDGYTDLKKDGAMDWDYAWADSGGGNVAMMARLRTMGAGETVTFDMAVGFGDSHSSAVAQADGSLLAGYSAILNRFNGTGSEIGWEDYLTGLSNLPSMIPFSGDNGKELYVSALVLKAHEDKTHSGALVASLSIPWGDTVKADSFQTGYRAVWPRDFYQCAMALLAAGDTKTPLVSLDYLRKVQVDRNTRNIGGDTGWFLQKTRVDGSQEWIHVQMDQTAMPIMLGWKLWKARIISDVEITSWYYTMLKPAAEFLANGGLVQLTFGDGKTDTYIINPPWTKQERWEEEEGYSPSTTAAVVTGLIAAADMARHIGGIRDRRCRAL